ncbi:MAG: ArsC/Spx/MgsR family protein [Pseudomonadota bacterium]
MMSNPSVTFYEKPGCITNAKQKRMLRELGVNVEVKSILTEPWTPDSLTMFFGALPVANWFNENAPTVKSGEVKPDTLNASDAIALMLKEPILIKRPLIRTAGNAICGFDIPLICGELSLEISNHSGSSDLHECSKTSAGNANGKNKLEEGSCP